MKYHESKYIYIIDMTREEVVEQLASNHYVEKLVSRYCFTKELRSNPYIDDLSQDIYVELLTKDSKLIVGLYKRNELEYFIRKMIANNLMSNTSHFYVKYRKFQKITENILFDENGEEKNVPTDL